MNLAVAESLEILVVVDNYADVLLASETGVERPSNVDGDSISPDTLLAEHGLCLLLRAASRSHRSCILLDAGYGPVAAPRNLALMREPLDDVSALVVSHGHADHIGALLAVLEAANRPPLIVHPEAFRRPRFNQADNGHLLRMPAMPQRSVLEREGIEIVDSTSPTVVGQIFLVTGEIPRLTSFEHGFLGARRIVGGKLAHDPILDDQAVVVDVREQGLVVVSGCAHAGIVNTIRYARELAPGKPIHAVVGGFHLAGEVKQSVIDLTLDAIAKERPARVVPMHCTGVRAKRAFANRFGAACVDSCVGTRLRFGRRADTGM